MNRGDVYLVSLDPTQGREQQGRRPVVIVSPLAFTEATKLPVVLPITTGGGFVKRLGFAVPISGIGVTGIVRCDQPRVLDIAARQGRLIDVLPPAILTDVMAKVGLIFA